jgi:two-component system, NarL family, invasion response regulator UvrY
MTRILLIDDHAVVRDGIKRMFDDRTGTVEFGEADQPGTALKLVEEQDWDVVILDLTLGNRSGLEVLRDLKRIRPRLPILILSMHSEEQYARRVFKAGASGYVTKDCSRAELVGAIDKVIGGSRYISASLAEKLVIDLERGTDGPLHETLSDREFEVMQLIASGKTVSEIAEILTLSDKTISTYRARILEKMRMKTNAELTHYAIQNNLVKL